ncbi:hypothetical protein C1I58_25080 [Bacillus sp. PIC28]|nr:hypothetical protein C1I58_25080 [Bacillus sp. PIC28]
MKLEIKNVTKVFKRKSAVNNFSMELQAGECVGLIGPNGAGKSTLIKVISDIIHPTAGEVLLNGIKISKMKSEIGYLPQYPNFFHWMTARETLTFMGQLSGLKKEELSKSIPKILEKVGLKDEENAKVSTFSGGMKQRLGIAQALLHKPSLIVMDEPVSALDPIGRREVLNLIEEIKKDTTILLSTHILGDAEEICERFVIIKDGTKIEDTTITELLHRNSENKLMIEITAKDQKWIEIVKKLPYVKDVEVVGLKIKVKVESIEINKNYLFTVVPFAHLITGLLFYLIWVLFIVSFTTMISAIFQSQGMIALISIVFLLACRVIVGLNPIMDQLNPASMSKYAMEMLVTGGVNSNAIINGLLTIVWILLTLFVTFYWIANKKFNDE